MSVLPCDTELFRSTDLHYIGTEFTNDPSVVNFILQCNAGDTEFQLIRCNLQDGRWSRHISCESAGKFFCLAPSQGLKCEGCNAGVRHSPKELKNWSPPFLPLLNLKKFQWQSTHARQFLHLSPLPPPSKNQTEKPSIIPIHKVRVLPAEESLHSAM